MNQLKALIRTAVLCLALASIGSVPSEASRPAESWGFTHSVKKNKWGYYAYPIITESEMSEIFKSRIKGWSGDPLQLARHFLKLCEENEFDPAFVLSLIKAESNFRADVVSSAGAIGLTQLMPGTAWVVARKTKKYKNRKLNLKNPFVNLELGILYLSFLRHRYRSKVQDFLGAYNAGPYAFDEFKEKKYRITTINRYVAKVMKGIMEWRKEKEEESEEENS